MSLLVGYLRNRKHHRKEKKTKFHIHLLGVRSTPVYAVLSVISWYYASLRIGRRTAMLYAICNLPTSVENHLITGETGHVTVSALTIKYVCFLSYKRRRESWWRNGSDVRLVAFSQWGSKLRFDLNRDRIRGVLIWSVNRRFDLKRAIWFWFYLNLSRLDSRL